MAEIDAKAGHVIVIGAGVIGLSTATLLQEHNFAVTLLAKDFPGPFATIDPHQQINYTSPWGGAHNRWVPPTPNGPAHEVRDHGFALSTFQRMKRLAAEQEGGKIVAGLTFMKGVEYLEKPPAEYHALDEGKAEELGLTGFRRLKEDELPDEKVVWGCEYDTWCVNPMVYCSFLMQRISFRGGKVMRAELRSPLEAFDFVPDRETAIVVNCSGNGFDDENMFVTRGQTVLVANTCPATVTRQNADGTWTFCVPRNFEGGTVIGGTKEPDNWSTKPDPVVRDKLIKSFVATYPQIAASDGGVTVLADIVGRRPTRRGGARIETEGVGGGRSVVHAYGVGGRGFEMSWGVAEKAVELVKEAL